MSIPDKKGKEDIRKGIITAMSKEGATFLYTEMWILEKKRTDEDMATFPPNRSSSRFRFGNKGEKGEVRMACCCRA